MFLSAAIALGAGLLGAGLLGPALAGPDDTPDAMDRLEETLELRVEDGLLALEDVTPAILVSATPRYLASEGWFVTRAIEALEVSLGEGSLRLCEACMVPRVAAADGALVYQSGPVSLDEIARLDDLARGEAPPARAAIWLDEHRGGVSLRIVDLQTGRVLYAQNFDPNLTELANTQRTYTLSEELERRARGDGLTQSFADFALFPRQHISLDWTDQWGPDNHNLSGLTVSLVDPVLGVGACHYRVTDLFDVMVGGKVLLSLPTALVQSVGEDIDGDVIDPLLNIVVAARYPFGHSNYGLVFTASTNGTIGLGVSLLNVHLLSVLR